MDDANKIRKVCSVDVVSIIQVMVTVGTLNSDNDPRRVIVQYWDMQGNLLCERDPKDEPCVKFGH